MTKRLAVVAVLTLALSSTASAQSICDPSYQHQYAAQNWGAVYDASAEECELCDPECYDNAANVANEYYGEMLAAEQGFCQAVRTEQIGCITGVFDCSWSEVFTNYNAIWRAFWGHY